MMFAGCKFLARCW